MAASRKTPVLVECIGLQGAGKSTLVRALAQARSYRQVPSDFGWKRHAFFFLCAHPFFACRWICTVLAQGGGVRMIGYQLYMFLVKAARWHYAAGLPESDIYILDESFLQAVGALYRRGISETAARTWLRIMPKGQIVVWVERSAKHDPAAHLSAGIAALGPERALKWQRTFDSNLTVLRQVLWDDPSSALLQCVSDDPAACDRAIRAAAIRI